MWFSVLVAIVLAVLIVGAVTSDDPSNATANMTITFGACLVVLGYYIILSLPDKTPVTYVGRPAAPVPAKVPAPAPSAQAPIVVNVKIPRSALRRRGAGAVQAFASGYSSSGSSVSSGSSSSGPSITAK